MRHLRWWCEAESAKCDRRAKWESVGRVLGGCGWAWWYAPGMRVGAVGRDSEAWHPGAAQTPVVPAVGLERGVLRWAVSGRTHTVQEERARCLWGVWRETHGAGGRVEEFEADMIQALSRAIGAFQAGGQGTALVRQAPPALRAWLLQHVMGGEGCEALQTVLTLTSGHFPGRSRLLSEGGGTLEGPWGGLDDVTGEDWEGVPWGGKVLVSISDEDPDAARRVLKKSRATSEAGGVAVVILECAQLKWEELRGMKARSTLELPPGCIPWGHAAG